MPETRKIYKILKSKPTIEDAGVHLHRAFGFGETHTFDPFLLLDDFRGDHPDDYKAGFPWHPHRGIETITYVLRGKVAHGDSLGNQGSITAGDVQWMTAGSGILHQEMPEGDPDGRMYGFQLWANLPRADKLMAPRYQDIKSQQIPLVTLEGGVLVRVICGEVADVRGPVENIVIDPQYLDITMPAGTRFVFPTASGRTVFAYVFEGKANFHKEKELGSTPSAFAQLMENRTLIIYEDGEQIVVNTAEDPVRFLLVSGRPIREPVAWYGPIVMNTDEELRTAYNELQNGTFIKQKKNI
jgi:hypothetical protein